MKKLRYRQFEYALPIYLAKEVLMAVKKDDSTVTYQTHWFTDVIEQDQLATIMQFQEKGMVEAPDIINDKEATRLRGRKQYKLRDELWTSGKTLAFPIKVLPELEKFYKSKTSYEKRIAAEETSLRKMEQGLKDSLEEKAIKLDKECLQVFDSDLPEELNPYLAALSLESKNYISIVELLPPARFSRQPSVILKLELCNAKPEIKTSRFEYNTKSGEIKLSNKKLIPLNPEQQLGRVLIAMYNNKEYFLSDKEIMEVSHSASKKAVGEASRQKIGEIRKKLGIAEGSESDIIRDGKNKDGEYGYFLIE